MGIDPGSRLTGYAFLEDVKNGFKVHGLGCVDLRSFDNMGDKLNHLHKALRELVDQFKPDAGAVETQFYGANAKTAFIIGQVRGCVLLTFSEFTLPYGEYPPATVKKAVTGNGQAKKDQLARTLERLTGLKNLEDNLDASDALGIAFTYLQQNQHSSYKTEPGKL